MNSIERIVQLFENRGHSLYGGEDVTQLEHALQCATLAEAEGATPTLVVAALLHDIGHLLHELPDDAPDQGIDDCHESSAMPFLENIFPPAVTEPIRLHVEAKRYLCATEDGYVEQLSEPSRQSLELQGGVFTSMEVDAFEQLPFASDAVRLRYWDDAAKDPEFKTPSIDHFVEIMCSLAQDH